MTSYAVVDVVCCRMTSDVVCCRMTSYAVVESPADGVSNYFRVSMETVISPDGSISSYPEVGRSIELTAGGKEIRDAFADTTGRTHAWGSSSGSGVIIGSIAAIGEPFEQPISNYVAPIYMTSSISINRETGMLNGSFTTSNFPSFQFFVNGKSVLNVKQGPSPTDIFGSSKHSVNKQLCDPKK